MNYHNKIFRAVSNSESGESSSETLFYYQQEDNILYADYNGGSIIKGHLIGKVSEDGKIDMRYHHINSNGILMTGVCKSSPEILEDGRIRLHESWQWTCGDRSKGASIIEELDDSVH